MNIQTFQASPSTIQPGGTSHLELGDPGRHFGYHLAGSWQRERPHGSAQVSPTATTTYTLTATGPAGTANATVVVTVQAVPGA